MYMVNPTESTTTGLSTAPMEFTTVVKLVAQNKGIIIHKNEDDWLVRATSHQAYLK